MDLFSFTAWILLTVVFVTIVWPLNVPMLALAIKIRRAPQPIGYEPAELWWRCTFGSLGLGWLFGLGGWLATSWVYWLTPAAKSGPAAFFLGGFA